MGSVILHYVILHTMRISRLYIPTNLSLIATVVTFKLLLEANSHIVSAWFNGVWLEVNVLNV
jgi:hypothetical protein